MNRVRAAPASLMTGLILADAAAAGRRSACTPRSEERAKARALMTERAAALAREDPDA